MHSRALRPPILTSLQIAALCSHPLVTTASPPVQSPFDAIALPVRANSLVGTWTGSGGGGAGGGGAMYESISATALTQWLLVAPPVRAVNPRNAGLGRA